MRTKRVKIACANQIFESITVITNFGEHCPANFLVGVSQAVSAIRYNPVEVGLAGWTSVIPEYMGPNYATKGV